MKDAGHVALIETLKRQGCNESCAHTATVLGCQNLNRILLPGILLLRPVKNLSERHGATSLEVGILVEDGTVSTNVASLVALLLANGGHTTCRETGGSGANQLSKPTDKLKLGAGGCEI